MWGWGGGGSEDDFGKEGNGTGKEEERGGGGWVGERERVPEVGEVKVKVGGGRKVITLLKLMAKVDERGTR